MTRPETCPKCSDRWQSYGPYGRRECHNEHVFTPNDAGTFTLVDYPDFDDDQVRGAEVELYRTRRIDRAPDRPAALRLLRREHDEQRDLGWEPVRGA